MRQIRIRAIVCVGLAIAWTGIVGALLIPVLIVLLLVPRSEEVRGKIAYWYARRFWAPVISFIAGVRYDVRGKSLIPKDEDLIFAANHESLFDFFALMCLIPQARFVAKIEISAARVPVVGLVVAMANQIRIDRANPKAAMAEMIRHAMKYAGHIIVFPQGTRSSESSPKPFKHGAATLAIKTKRKIVPVRIKGTWGIVGDGWFNLRRGARVIVEACSPIDTTSLHDAACLMQTVESAILEKGAEHERHPYGARCISWRPYDDDCPYVRQTVPHR